MSALFKLLEAWWDGFKRLNRTPTRACVECYKAGKFPEFTPCFYAFHEVGACESCGRAVAPRDSIPLVG